MLNSLSVKFSVQSDDFSFLSYHKVHFTRLKCKFQTCKCINPLNLIKNIGIQIVWLILNYKVFFELFAFFKNLIKSFYEIF